MRRWYIYFGLLVAASRLCAATSSMCKPSEALASRLQAQPSADTYAAAGMWYGDHAQYACAVGAYQSALKQQPKSAELLYLLGLNLLRNGDFSAAVEALEQSIEIKPGILKPHLLLASANEELGHGPQARIEWMAALEIDPHSDMALDGASKNFLAANEFDSVIALLGPQPKGEALTLDLASAYEKSGNTEQANQILKEGLQANPKSSALTRELITNLYLGQRYSEAAQLGKKLVEQSPHDLDAEELYLHVLILNGDDELARPLAHKLLAVAPHNFGVLYLNGVLENKSGNYAGGRAFLEKAVALNADDFNGHYNLGIALANLNQPQKAREQFEKALALGASEPAVRFEYVKVLQALGETKLASEQLALYQEEQKAKAGRTQAAISMGQGDKELAAGNAKRAAEFYRDAIRVRPNYALLHYKLSLALDRAGDAVAERDALRKAIEIDPDMAIAHRQLGYVDFNDGDFQSAEAEFRAAVRAAPKYTDAWISLAATLATESRPSEAEQAVQHALEIDPQNANAIELQKELANAARPQSNQ